MLSDPRLYGVVNGIIVEYQDTLDRLIVGDAPVNDADPCLVWRNTTQSPNIILDAPIYVQTYRRVRAAKWTLPPADHLRSLHPVPPGRAV